MTELTLSAKDFVHRVRIRDALTEYFRALENRDWDLVERTFTPDASLDYGTPGVRDVRQNIALLRAGVERNTSLSTLLGMEPVIVLNSAGARTRTLAFTTHLPVDASSGGAPARMSAVRYEDEWQIDSSDSWRIRCRVCHHEFKGWLPLS